MWRSLTGFSAMTMAAREMRSAAKSVNMWPASDNRAREWERNPPTTSRIRMEPVMPMAQSIWPRRLGPWEWSWPCGNPARVWECSWERGIGLFYRFQMAASQEIKVGFLDLMPRKTG